MSGIPIPCLECGLPSDSGRCQRHKLPQTAKPSPSRRGYDAAWRKLSRLARSIQPWCSDCGSTADLTADHLRWPATCLGDVDVVCRACNSARGAVRGGRGPLKGASMDTPRVPKLSHSRGRPS